MKPQSKSPKHITMKRKNTMDTNERYFNELVTKYYLSDPRTDLSGGGKSLTETRSHPSERELVGAGGVSDDPTPDARASSAQNLCKHNAMTENNDPIHAWKCADCGYVYGQDDASNPQDKQSTTADTKPEELSRTESLTDWYDHERNDLDRGDLRDEGRNPDGSGESYADRNL